MSVKELLQFYTEFSKATKYNINYENLNRLRIKRGHDYIRLNTEQINTIIEYLTQKHTENLVVYSKSAHFELPNKEMEVMYIKNSQKNSESEMKEVEVQTDTQTDMEVRAQTESQSPATDRTMFRFS